MLTFVNIVHLLYVVKRRESFSVTSKKRREPARIRERLYPAPRNVSEKPATEKVELTKTLFSDDF